MDSPPTDQPNVPQSGLLNRTTASDDFLSPRTSPYLKNETRSASQFLLAAASVGLLSQSSTALGAFYDDVAVDLPNGPLGTAFSFLAIQGVNGNFLSAPFESQDYFTLSHLLPGSILTVDSTWTLSGSAFSFDEEFTNSSNFILGAVSSGTSGAANFPITVPADGIVRARIIGGIEGGSVTYSLEFKGTPIPETGTSVAAAAVGLAALLAARRQRAGMIAP